MKYRFEIDLTDEMVVAAMEHVAGSDHDDMVNAVEAALAKAAPVYKIAPDMLACLKVVLPVLESAQRIFAMTGLAKGYMAGGPLDDAVRELIATAESGPLPVGGKTVEQGLREALKDLADAARSACDARQHTPLIEALTEADRLVAGGQP